MHDNDDYILIQLIYLFRK